MEKLEVQTGQKKEVVAYNESKFVEVGSKFAENIYLPKDYDVVGSMKALHLMCISSQSGDLTKLCSPVSIEMAIRETLQKGLNPIKKQCYPIKMGDKLVVMPSYQGNQRVVYSANKDVIKGSIFAQCVFKGDTIEDKITADGRRVILSHKQPPFAERSDEIIGAYATVQIKLNGKIVTDTELMTMKEIKSSWAMSRGNGDVHKKFPVEMSKRTVINRLCKRLYGWTDEEAEQNISSSGEFEIPSDSVYDIDTNETVIEVNEKDVVKVEETNDIPEGANVVDCVEIKEVTQKTEAGTYKIDYKVYLDNKDKYEKVEYIESEKKIIVKDKK